jgi:hypothetical protein
MVDTPSIGHSQIQPGEFAVTIKNGLIICPAAAAYLPGATDSFMDVVADIC